MEESSIDPEDPKDSDQEEVKDPVSDPYDIREAGTVRMSIPREMLEEMRHIQAQLSGKSDPSKSEDASDEQEVRDVGSDHKIRIRQGQNGFEVVPPPPPGLP